MPMTQQLCVVCNPAFLLYVTEEEAVLELGSVCLGHADVQRVATVCR